MNADVAPHAVAQMTCSDGVSIAYDTIPVVAQQAIISLSRKSLRTLATNRIFSHRKHGVFFSPAPGGTPPFARALLL